MAFTFGAITRIKAQNKLINMVPVTFDSSYPTGGLALTKANIGLVVPDVIFAIPASGYTFQYDAVNSKLKAYASAGTEVANATSLATVVATVIAIGS